MMESAGRVGGHGAGRPRPIPGRATSRVNPSFNPYHEFLGLDPRLTAPTYYQLLGLVPEESDPARITAAAERALAQVRGCRPGQQAAAWARLLDELTAAKTCLRDPVQKAAYDAAGPAAGPAPPTAPPAHGADARWVPEIPPSTPPAHRPQPAPGTPAAARNPLPPTGVRILDGTLAATPLPPTAAPHPPPPPAAPPASSGRAAPELEPAGGVGVAAPAAQPPVNAHVAPPAAPRNSLLPLVASVAAFFAVLTLIMLAVALRDPGAATPATAPKSTPSTVPTAPEGHAPGARQRPTPTSAPRAAAPSPGTRPAAHATNSPRSTRRRVLANGR